MRRAAYGYFSTSLFNEEGKLNRLSHTASIVNQNIYSRLPSTCTVKALYVLIGFLFSKTWRNYRHCLRRFNVTEQVEHACVLPTHRTMILRGCRPLFPFVAGGASIDAGVVVCGLCERAAPRAHAFWSKYGCQAAADIISLWSSIWLVPPSTYVVSTHWLILSLECSSVTSARLSIYFEHWLTS